MNKQRLLLWSVLLLLLQIVILNHINLYHSINPYLYIALIFIFPLSENRFTFLISVFIYGLVLDFFSDTGGIHTFSTVFIAYTRLFFIRLFFKKENIDYFLFDLNSEPFGQVFNYVAVLTLTHHFILFSLDNFSTKNIAIVLENTLYSGTLTLSLYFLISYLFMRKQRR